MFDKKSKENLMQYLFQNPRKSYHIRKLARKTNLSASTISKTIKELQKKEFVEVKKGVTKQVRLSQNNKTKDYKRAYNLLKLTDSGLIDYLEKNLYPDTIVLFGSYSRGEDDSNSDIDLAIINGNNKGTQLDLDEFEKELERSVNLQEIDLKDVGENFKLTLANGIVLRGYLEL
ncbi:hypothetical protein C9439_04105 [archaeon SCG-AAA382B04]|nr:hypothetical protein C9439_04105 [archaeon SCG-AAA382B04]